MKTNPILEQVEREIVNQFGEDLNKQRQELASYRWPALTQEEMQTGDLTAERA